MKSFLILKVVIDLHVRTCIFNLKGQCRHHMEVRQFYRSAALILGTKPVCICWIVDRACPSVCLNLAARRSKTGE